MYRAWAAARGVQVTAVAEDRERGRRVLLLEGLGVLDALAGEEGLHVWERREGGRAERVAAVRVAVAGWPGAPDADVAAAARALATSGEPRIVRRYQREPTPLVRDAVHGWRTGRLDRVLAGDFDLFGEPG